MPARDYYWFDTPDGKDVLRKTNFAAKLGFGAGVGAAIFDHCFVPQPNLKTYAFRAAAWVVPAVGTSVAFALTSQMLCKHFPQLRPDFAYVIGSVAAGSVVGAASRSWHIGTVCCFYLGVTSLFAHDMHVQWGRIPSIIGQLPTQPVINDDELFLMDFRNAPPLSRPPPAAQPPKAPSMLKAWIN